MRDNSPADLQWGTVGVTISKSVLVALLALLVAVGLTVGATGALASSSGDDEHAPADDTYAELVVTADCDEKNGSVLEIENPNDEAASLAIAWESDDPSLSVQSDGQISTQVQTSSQATASGTETVQTLTATVSGDETVAITGLQDGTYDLSATIDETEVGIAYDETEDKDEGGVFDRTDEGHVELTLECDATDESAPIFLTVVDEDHDEKAAVDVATTDDKHEDETAADALETAKAITDSLFETDEKAAEKDDEKADDKDEHDDKNADDKDDEKDKHDDKKADEKADDKDEHDDKKDDGHEDDEETKH